MIRNRSPRSEFRSDEFHSRRRFNLAPMPAPVTKTDERAANWIGGVVFTIAILVACCEINSSKDANRIYQQLTDCTDKGQRAVKVNNGERDEVMCVGEGR